MKDIEAIRKRIKAIEAEIENEPYIILPEGVEPIVSKKAQTFVAHYGINFKEFLSALKTKARQCCEVKHGPLEVALIRIGTTGTVLALLKRSESPEKERHCPLTAKERQILSLLIRGLTNKEIASELSISPGTVNTHLDNIYRKLEVTNRLMACFIAVKHGIVDIH